MKIDFGEPIEFEIPAADFPLASIPLKSLASRAEKKVFVLKSAYGEMIEHVNIDKNIECGGVLVGYPFQDPDTEEIFIVIVGVIRDLSDNRSVVHFTVTPDVISKTREVLEEKYPELIAVGWYHSHPGHGVFLSGQDMTIVRGIYNEEWNLAWVVDPIREQEGIFYGADGEPLVKNKSTNPLFVNNKQTWFALDESPQCIKDLQSGKLKAVSEKIEPKHKRVAPNVLESERERKESTPQKKNSLSIRLVVFAGIGIATIAVISVIVFFYIRSSPIIYLTATPVIPIVFTPIPSETPTIPPTATPEWTPTLDATIELLTSVPSIVDPDSSIPSHP